MPQGKVKFEEKTRDTLESALREHRELRGIVEDLRLFLGRERPAIGEKGYHTWAADLSARLVHLHDKLFRHFRDEEQSGMLQDLGRLHPRATSQIGTLEAQHGEILGLLRETMTDTLSYSEGRSPADSRLRQRVNELLGKADEHEKAETELLQELLYSDLGEAG